MIPDHPDRLVFDDLEAARLLFGEHDRNLRLIERRSGVEIYARGNEVTINGDPDRKHLAEQLLLDYYALLQTGRLEDRKDFEEAFRTVDSGATDRLTEVYDKVITETHRRKPVTPRTDNQRRYCEAVERNDLVFAVGPAGTGKTYLAVALAVAALKRKEFSRIILTRPAVEAGERLGFLPGDLTEKIHPYLRPLYDALFDMIEPRKVKSLVESEVIEVAPLAFMRGRTLNNAFVILDEAQNATGPQMKMFLTRLGFDSKAVVTGDLTQIDLERKISSGLKEAHRILGGVEGIGFIRFESRDVVRHRLVRDIVEAYERDGIERAAAEQANAESDAAGGGDSEPAGELAPDGYSAENSGERP